jgi:hypothetical protein
LQNKKQVRLKWGQPGGFDFVTRNAGQMLSASRGGISTLFLPSSGESVARASTPAGSSASRRRGRLRYKNRAKMNPARVSGTKKVTVARRFSNLMAW